MQPSNSLSSTSRGRRVYTATGQYRRYFWVHYDERQQDVICFQVRAKCEYCIIVEMHCKRVNDVIVSIIIFFVIAKHQNKICVLHGDLTWQGHGVVLCDGEETPTLM